MPKNSNCRRGFVTASKLLRALYHCKVAASCNVTIRDTLTHPGQLLYESMSTSPGIDATISTTYNSVAPNSNSVAPLNEALMAPVDRN